MSLQTRSVPISANRSGCLELTVELVRSVFCEVWREFYAWERSYSREAMASLARQAGPNQEQSFCETSAVVPDTLGISPDNSFGDQQQQFIVYNFQTASSFTVAHLSVLSTDIQEIVSQDCYEACTPASSNIIQGDDPNNIPFIPFSDDPKFNIRDHLLEHQGLEWQNEGNDPDCEWTARIAVCY